MPGERFYAASDKQAARATHVMVVIASQDEEVAMNVGRALKRKAKALLPPLLFMALTGYFCLNATQGDRGLRSYALREQQLTTVKAELAAAQDETGNWERKVAGLRANHVDPDTLDERSRAMLNLADPSDIVVPYGPGKKLF
jgi:cell division protein FtsB